MDGITLVTLVDAPDVEQVKQTIRYLIEKGIYERRIWDLSRITFPYTMDELKELAQFSREAIGNSTRVALVVKDATGFGSSRAFSAHRGGDNVTNARVCKTLDEALQWVSEGT